MERLNSPARRRHLRSRPFFWPFLVADNLAHKEPIGWRWHDTSAASLAKIVLWVRKALPADSLTDYNSADVWTRLRNLHRRGTLFPISEQASTEIASVHAGLQLVPDTRLTGIKARRRRAA